MHPITQKWLDLYQPFFQKEWEKAATPNWMGTKPKLKPDRYRIHTVPTLQDCIFSSLNRFFDNEGYLYFLWENAEKNCKPARHQS
jgi:hypothetical protein